MTPFLALFLASKFLGVPFVLLLIVGGLRRMRGRFNPLGHRRRSVQMTAAGRFARGEIDAATYRQIRDDLKDLA
ncbi:MAG: hypothetical protein WCR49_15580 [Opitutae bacterium]